MVVFRTMAYSEKEYKDKCVQPQDKALHLCGYAVVAVVQKCWKGLQRCFVLMTRAL